MRMLAQRQIRRRAQSREVESRSRSVLRLIVVGITALTVLEVQKATAQNGQTGSALRLGIAEIPTPLNQLPDANVQMALQAKKKALNRFDAANALRQKQMVDEAARLLLLAQDLRAKMQRCGEGPLPERLLQEVEAIESLAHDVQARMVLTVGGG